MLEERNDNNGNTSIATQEPLWIPTGFKHLTGDLDTGYVVVDSLENEFTYLNGIYVSRYEISRGENGIPVSLPNKPAWTWISYWRAKEVIKEFGKSGNCNYTVDLINDWISEIVEPIATKIDKKLVYEDSTSIGAYGRDCSTYRMEIYTGSNPKFMTYNISDLTGNHECLTNQKGHTNHRVAGGGHFYASGYSMPMASCRDVNLDCDIVGFRIVLRKKVA